MVRLQLPLQIRHFALNRRSSTKLGWWIRVVLLATAITAYVFWDEIYEFVTGDDPFDDPIPYNIDKDSEGFPKILAPYKEFALTRHEKKVLIDSLLAFDRIVRIKQKKTYLVLCGSLLGMIRHGGLIPFDDDIDVAVNKTDFDHLTEILEGSELMVDRYYTHDLKKVRLRDPAYNLTMPVPRGSWRWPYLDVWYYEEKDGKVLFSWGDDKSIFQHEHSFPPIMLPFEGHYLPTIKCPDIFLIRTYNKKISFKCCVDSLSHKFHKKRMFFKKCFHCKIFHHISSYVFWNRLNKTHMEYFVEPSLNADFHVSKEQSLSWTTVYKPKCDSDLVYQVSEL